MLDRSVAMRDLKLKEDGTVVAVAGSSGVTSPTDPIDESDPRYFYSGYESVNGGWLIIRQTRSLTLTERATVANNPTYTDYASAYAARATLTYEAS